MWEPLLEPRLTRVQAHARHLWACVQEVIHHTVHTRPGTVLVCDGSHGFNPYDFAEVNLVRGHAADFGAQRVLVKRAMTAFQWDSILDKHVAARLAMGGVSLVVAAPYDALFAHEELQDWEQEDHLRFSVADLAAKAQRFQVPILAFVDTVLQAHRYPVLWGIQEAAVGRKWHAWLQGGSWRLADEADPDAPQAPVAGTLEAFAAPDLDYVQLPEVLLPRPAPRRADGVRRPQPGTG